MDSLFPQIGSVDSLGIVVWDVGELGGLGD